MDYTDINHRLELIKTAVEELNASANQDGKITPEEQKILDLTAKTLNKYMKLVEDALEDKIVSEEELNQLIDVEEKLLEDIYFTAIEDGVIDTDEKKMIQSIFKTIAPKASLDWLDLD